VAGRRTGHVQQGRTRVAATVDRAPSAADAAGRGSREAAFDFAANDPVSIVDHIDGHRRRAAPPPSAAAMAFFLLGWGLVLGATAGALSATERD